MPAERLEHFTIECADLERTRSFYCDVLGLTSGFRPRMDFPGHWLYCGGVPVVHLMKRDAAARPRESTGRLDHIAFRCTDPEDTLARLGERNIPYTDNKLADAGLWQVFVRDPEGILVELNFHNVLRQRR